MSFFNRHGQALSLLAAVVVGAVLMLGCGGDNGANPDDGGGPNNPVVPGGGGSNVTGGTNCTSGATCKTVEIGTQVWMAENLNIATADSWCYDNNQSNCAKYGRLYTWAAAKTACPTGWHLPSEQEWWTLVGYVGHVGSSTGTKLKSTSGWEDNGNGTDEYGFSALPSGVRYYGGFIYAGIGGYWWMATEYSDSNACTVDMHSTNDEFGEWNNDKDNGFSVRCIGD